MKKSIFLFLVLLVCFLIPLHSEEIVTTSDGRKIVLYDDHTWKEYSESKSIDIKSFKNELRRNVKASEGEINVACEMLNDGWAYTMPQPKSAKAAWGVSDRRTTWWNGYWYNKSTKQYSDTTPIKSKSGLYLGDNQNSSGTWRNGGSPAKPDVYMYLLSESGGPNY
jgi:hypothetical protein